MCSFLCLFSQRYNKIPLLIFKEELCYNKYRRRSRRLYLQSKYREIHAVRRGFEYLFQHKLRKSEAFEESNLCYKIASSVKPLNFITLRGCAKAICAVTA